MRGSKKDKKDNTFVFFLSFLPFLLLRVFIIESLIFQMLPDIRPGLLEARGL